MPGAPLIENEMIFASAGSGKTYALTNRYIRLMGLGVEPERIIALTFTRKAAGEFFDAILGKLAAAATDPDKARKLAADIDLPRLDHADFLRHLRVLVSNMHRLSLGTLDRFFSSILRSFPFEFGLSGGFEILEGHAADQARAAVYERVFRRDPRRRQAQDDFLESFRLATFGAEENSLMRELGKFVETYHARFLEAPQAAQWGNPKTIWPRGSIWLPAPVDSREALFERLFSHFENDGLKDKQRSRWRDFRDAHVKHDPGHPIEGPLKYLLDKLLNHLPEIVAGSAELVYDHGRQSLDAGECALVLDILRHLIGAELEIRLRRTRGIWSVLDQYETAYGEIVRRRGRLTFSDILIVLAGGDDSPQSRRVLTQDDDPEDRRANRLHIDYRLDARYDHWLLDEFQDTSRPQWRVIANLIDEAVQDISGERSLFQVGDLKQAIYGWRGGDVRLFEEIRETYRDRVTERPLNDSWRSAPPVIEMVNAVFGNVRTMDEFFPDEVRRRWEWGEHVSKHPEWSGHAAYLRPSGDGDGEDSKDERRFAIVAEILRDLRPAERGLSCAILVQSRKAGESIIDYLRAHLGNVPVQREADASVASDNPLAAAVLALFKLAAHPGDTFAREHLRMTPLGSVPEGMNTARVRADLHARGFEFAIRGILARLAGGGIMLDAFTTARAESLCAAARTFDLAGDKCIDTFIAAAVAHLASEPAARGVVQVMTVHKSKGLGFDVVLLPDLGGTAMTTVRDHSLAVHRDSTHEVDWLLALPPALIANADPVLAAHLDRQKSEACYEQLCKFYVALTRAKRAVYLILDRPPKKSASQNFPMLLDLSLGAETEEIELGSLAVEQVHAYGPRDWYEAFPLGATTPDSALEPQRFPPVAPATFAPRHRRRTPSSAQPRALGAAQLFARSGSAGRDFGNAVHALFETIEWLDVPFDEATLHNRWQTLQAPEDAVAEVLACLRAPALRDLFEPQDARCWRERRFEVLLRGDWLSGAFDRVILSVKAARIIDFKTDRDPRPDAYAAQLGVYRQALARLTGMPESAIQCEIVSTATAGRFLVPL